MEDYVIRLTFKGRKPPSENKMKLIMKYFKQVASIFDFQILQHGSMTDMVASMADESTFKRIRIEEI